MSRDVFGSCTWRDVHTISLPRLGFRVQGLKSNERLPRSVRAAYLCDCAQKSGGGGGEVLGCLCSRTHSSFFCRSSQCASRAIMCSCVVEVEQGRTVTAALD